jgi:hypothetical protein
MADVKVSALTTLSSIAEADVFIVNDDDAVGEKVKKATTPVLRTAILLPGVDNTNDIGSATKQVKDIYLKGTITLNAIPQGKDVTAALHRKILTIGDWDMDATLSVNVAHGLTFTKIREVTVLIIDDASSKISPLNTSQPAGEVAGFWFLDSTNVSIYRFAGGSFDSTLYNATSFNRGWVTIWYVD